MAQRSNEISAVLQRYYQGTSLIKSDSEFFDAYFTCKVCLKVLNPDHEWCCSTCLNLFCFDCLTRLLVVKKECPFKCTEPDYVNNGVVVNTKVKFCRPPTMLLALYRRGTIWCSTCDRQLQGTLSFKLHKCKEVQLPTHQQVLQKTYQTKVKEDEVFKKPACKSNNEEIRELANMVRALRQNSKNFSKELNNSESSLKRMNQIMESSVNSYPIQRSISGLLDKYNPKDIFVHKQIYIHETLAMTQNSFAGHEIAGRNPGPPFKGSPNFIPGKHRDIHLENEMRKKMDPSSGAMFVPSVRLGSFGSMASKSTEPSRGSGCSASMPSGVTDDQNGEQLQGQGDSFNNGANVTSISRIGPDMNISESPFLNVSDRQVDPEQSFKIPLQAARPPQERVRPAEDDKQVAGSFFGDSIQPNNKPSFEKAKAPDQKRENFAAHDEPGNNNLDQAFNNSELQPQGQDPSEVPFGQLAKPEKKPDAAEGSPDPPSSKEMNKPVVDEPEFGALRQQEPRKLINHPPVPQKTHQTQQAWQQSEPQGYRSNRMINLVNFNGSDSEAEPSNQAPGQQAYCSSRGRGRGASFRNSNKARPQHQRVHEQKQQPPMKWVPKQQIRRASEEEKKEEEPMIAKAKSSAVVLDQSQPIKIKEDKSDVTMQEVADERNSARSKKKYDEDKDFEESDDKNSSSDCRGDGRRSRGIHRRKHRKTHSRRRKSASRGSQFTNDVEEARKRSNSQDEKQRQARAASHMIKNGGSRPGRYSEPRSMQMQRSQSRSSYHTAQGSPAKKQPPS